MIFDRNAAQSRERFHHVVSVSRNAAYPVDLVDSLLEDGLSSLADSLSGKRGIVVTTPTVATLYADRLMTRVGELGLDYTLLVIDCDEQGKSFDKMVRICDAALDRKLERNAVLVAFGGGVCSDLVTVAASLFRRGIATIRIPTTLIGQIDAAIGIKGAVNHCGKKSSFGCFHEPAHVLIDPAFLSSLPARHLRGGLAEIVKIALIRDARLFALVEAHGQALAIDGVNWISDHGREIIWSSISNMLAELEPNLFEDRSFERFVDLGHSFSPLVESLSDYAISHGEAVAIDMALSGAIAVVLGLLNEGDWRRYVAVIDQLGLPITSHHLDLDSQRASLIEMARHRGGTPNLVMPTGIGEVAILSDGAALDDPVLDRANQLLYSVGVRQ